MIPRSRGHGRRTTGAVYDTFERASLGADWSVPQGLAAIVGSSDLGATGSAGIHTAMWVGSAIGDDQYVEMTVASAVDPLMQWQVFCRRRSSDLARYGLIYDNDPSSANPAGWVFKYDGVPSSQTRFLVRDTVPPGPLPGDRLRLEVTGQNPVALRGFHNGRLIIEATDSAPDRVLSGPPGAAYRANVGSSPTYPVRIFADFAAGTLDGTG
jgi:hypothetical protein